MNRPTRRRVRPTVCRAVRRVFDVRTADATAPLVRRILGDVAGHTADRTRAQRALQQAQHAGHAGRHLGSLQDRLDAAVNALDQCRAELGDLGIRLLDAARGTAGLPTIVNGALAYLVVTHDDAAVRHWRYRDEDKLRPVPAAWNAHQPPMAVEQVEEGLLV